MTRQREAEAAAILERPIEASRIETIKTTIREAWNELSLVARLFSQVDQVELLDERPVGSESRIISVSVNIQRSFLVESDVAVDFGILGRDIALNLARQDLDRLASRAAPAPDIATNAADLRGRLADALKVLSATSEPMVVLAPRNLYIDIALGLLTASGSRGESVFGRAGVGHWYRGSIDGVPLVHSGAIPKDRVIVVGAAWGRYVSWAVSPSDELEFSVEDQEAPPKNVVLKTRRWAWIEALNTDAACGFRIDDLDLSFAAIRS